jgi:prepilin-type N-terminal cleavage/methylation domain-containing protein
MKKGFTLLELLIVLIIIGILAVIAAPQFFRTADRAKEAKAKDMVAQIGRISSTYRTIYGSFPTASGGSVIGVNMEGRAPSANNNDAEVTVPASDPDYTFSVSGGYVNANKQGSGSHRNVSLNLQNGQMTIQ